MLNRVKSMHKSGYLYAYLTVFMFALYNIIAKVSVTLGVQPVIFVCIGSLAGAVVLFKIAGPGDLGFETLKQPRTIIYSTLNLLEHIVTLNLFVYVAGTEGSLMQRLNIAVALLIAMLVMKRKQSKKDLIGCSIVVIGVTIVVSKIDPSVQGISIIWLILTVLCQAIKTFLVESHPQSNKAKTYKEQARVSAMIKFVTILIFLGSLFVVAIIKYFFEIEGSIMNHFPNLKDFLDPTTFIAGIIYGVICNAPATYCYFYATKMLKTEKILAMTAFVPLFTFAMEYTLYKYGIIDLSKFTDHALIAIALIVTGSLIMSLNLGNKSSNKLELEELRDREKNIKVT